MDPDQNKHIAVRANQPSSLSVKNRAGRAIWGIVWLLLFRPSPVVFHGWRRMLLRLFGASMAPRTKVYPSAVIWAPWNLVMKEGAVMGPGVICYSVATVTIGVEAVVSQYSHLCAATHDFEDPKFPLIACPITIGDQAWVTTDVFVGPGVTIGEGTVVGARSSVFSDLPPWKVCVGNPARPKRDRVVRGSD